MRLTGNPCLQVWVWMVVGLYVWPCDELVTYPGCNSALTARRLGETPETLQPWVAVAAAIENRSRNRSTSHVVFLIWEDGTEKTFRHICPPARSLELCLQSTLETTPMPPPPLSDKCNVAFLLESAISGGGGMIHWRLEPFVKLKVLKMWANCLKRDPLPPPVHLRTHWVVESLTAFHHWSRQDTANFSLCSDLFICGENNSWKHRTGCAEACLDTEGGHLLFGVVADLEVDVLHCALELEEKKKETETGKSAGWF